MIEHIGMFDAKTRFSEIVRMVKESGRRVIVTSRGREMVEIAPVRSDTGGGRGAIDAFEEIDRMRRERGRSQSDENRAAIEDGRL